MVSEMANLPPNCCEVATSPMLPAASPLFGGRRDGLTSPGGPKATEYLRVTIPV